MFRYSTFDVCVYAWLTEDMRASCVVPRAGVALHAPYWSCLRAGMVEGGLVVSYQSLRGRCLDMRHTYTMQHTATAYIMQHTSHSSEKVREHPSPCINDDALVIGVLVREQMHISVVL